MELEAPTFHSLNKPQKRALMLRDQLRWTDTHHLDTFISEVSEPEPPTYRRINGTVFPPLVLVTLHPAATRYDLGNVHFDTASEQGPAGIYRAYLTVEDGSFELRTEDALPAEEGNLESVPIHIFIAKTMVAMFETKFKAIWARKNQINGIRRVAFDVASKAPMVEEFRAGQTLSRLEYNRPAQNISSSQSKKAKKRRSGDPLPKHPSNKRTRIGLDTIPQDAKTATFNAIPNNIKVDLFNNVIKTAFPNFDNLMMASWNVVSVYSNVGTDFPELHKSIVELKNVLHDFEESFDLKVKKDELKLRRDFVPPSQEREREDDENDRSAQPTPTPDRIQQNGNDDSTIAPNDYGGSNMSPQQQNDVDALFEDRGPERDMRPPRIMQMSQRRQHSEDTDELVDPCTRRTSAILPTSQFTHEIQQSNSTRSSPALSVSRTSTKRKREPSLDSQNHSQTHHSTSELQRRRDEYRNNNSPSLAVQPPQIQIQSEDEDDEIPATPPKLLKDMTSLELRAKYKARKAELLETFNSNANVPQQYRLQMQELMKECKAREASEAAQREQLRERDEEDGRGEDVKGGGSEGAKVEGKGTAVPKFLGHSVLGGPKALGMAPVAPMVHTSSGSVLRRESGSGGGGGKKRD